MAARHPGRRALRLRRPFLARATFWKRVGQHPPSAVGTNVDVYRVLALQDAVERTRHIRSSPSSRLARRLPRRGCRSTPVTTRPSIRAAAAVTGASVLVDSSKHSALAPLPALPCPTSTCGSAHVVRDPRGVAHSLDQEWSTRPETDGAERDDPLLPGRSALLWNAHNAALRPARAPGACRSLRVRYEQFVAGPPGQPGRARRRSPGSGLNGVDLDFLTESTPT